MKNKTNWLALAILWFLITTILLCIPGKKIPQVGFLHLIPQFDKIVHIFLFAILSFLFCKTSKKKNYWIVAILCAVYGMVMEFVQKNYIPNRSFDILDIIADTVGSFAALMVLLKQKNNFYD